jgi:hypothetical protein
MVFVYQLEDFDLLLRICCLMWQMLEKYFFNRPYSDSRNMNYPFVVLEFFLLLAYLRFSS